jgi:ornithine carbamoyltransferase
MTLATDNAARRIEYVRDGEIKELVLTDSLRRKSILRDTDLTPAERDAILETAITLKAMRDAGEPHAWLGGKTLGMIFQHPSTRTRTAFQAGMEQLGGQAIFLGIQDLQLKRGETIADTAHIFSLYVDAVAARIADPADLASFAEGATVPVFNALTSHDHPLEALSDVFALYEHFGTLEGLKFAYLGDGNNVCHSLMLAMVSSGIDMTVATPPAFGPDPQVIADAQAIAAQTGAKLEFVDSAFDAASGADAVYTDVHESMGEQENPGKLIALAPYRVTREVMAQAKPEAVFMHCLPLHRGQEVEPEVADGPQSIIFDQAESRLHVHKAVLLQVLHDERDAGTAGSS